MENNREQDELLFAQLKKARRRRRRKVLITVLILLVLAGGGIFGAVTYLRTRVRTQFAANVAEVKSAQAVSGRISTTVSGSGTLSYMDYEDITLPNGVEVEELLVQAGQVVTAGTPIAKVDVNSVMTALADTQTELESLDDQIDSAKNDSVSSTMKSTVSGRIKCIYAQKGDNVIDVMTEHGALALISLDGLMTVTVDVPLSVGDAVTVLSGKKTYSGTVESCLAGKSVVCLTDNGPVYGAEAIVQDKKGNALGTGSLEIRNPLSVTGYAGTVSWVNVSENQQIYSGSGLFTLTNTTYTANYDSLLRSRSEKEKTLNTLIALLRSASVEAPIDGVIISAETHTDSISQSTDSEVVLATMAPNQQVCVSIGVDETDILSLELGQNAEVTISSIGEEIYEGTVTEISRIGTSQSGVTQYSAVVTLTKTEKMLAGMSASVDVQIQGVDDVVLIPVDALHQTKDMAYVYTSYDEELKEYGGMTQVETGVSNSSFVEIVSGLKPGDTVYYTEKTSEANTFFQMPGMSGMNGMNGMGGGFGSGSSGSNRPSGTGRSSGNSGGMGGTKAPGMGG